MARCGFHCLCEIAKRRIEIVIALADARTQHEHGRRRLGQCPPWPERTLRVSQVSRVALPPRFVYITPCKPGREREILVIARKLAAKATQLPGSGIKRTVAQTFENFAALLGNEGRAAGSRAPAERHDTRDHESRVAQRLARS
jgi:hypothetical protein